MISALDRTQSTLSSYQPKEAVIAITKSFKEGFSKGTEILNREWEELNNYSVIDRMNKDQRAFNAYVEENIEDPMESWKWKGTRSMALKKTIQTHAHMTSVLSVPMAFAQNDKQQEDRMMSTMMRDSIEWLAVNSEYRENYVACMLGTLVNPVTWMGAEMVESYVDVKDFDDEGNMQKKRVLDEELSGFRAPIYSADQVLISNAYEQNVQRQYTIIRREYKSYTDLMREWEWHPNWVYVQAGIKTVYSSEDGLFYDVKDDQHPDLVERATGYCRQTDTEVTFLNGIYMGDDDVDKNPIRHRDNFNIPKVPLVPFGYQRINEHFFFWKSLVNRIGWDNSLIDAMYENQMNRDAIDLYTPMAYYGVDEVSNNGVFPGSAVSFENPDARAEPLLPPGRGEGYRAMREVEQSIDEASISDVQAGNLPDASQKAFNVARAEQNARTIMRGAIRSISFSVMKYGDLMKDIVINDLSAVQIDEITGAETYRTLVLKDQMVDGKSVSKNIIFDDALVGRHMSKEEREKASLKMLRDIGWPKNKDHLYRINPHLASKMKYLIRIEPDEMIERNQAFERATAERMYGLLRNDPLIKGESILRKVLNSNYRGEADDMIQDVERQQPQQPVDMLKSNKSPLQSEELIE